MGLLRVHPDSEIHRTPDAIQENEGRRVIRRPSGVCRVDHVSAGLKHAHRYRHWRCSLISIHLRHACTIDAIPVLSYIPDDVECW